MPGSNAQYLVIGGTSGVGLALARQLCELGQVTIWSRTPSDDLPPGAQHRRWDARTSDGAPEIPERLSGLAYCPGSIRLKPVARLSDADFLDDFEINCLGAVRSIRACLPAMRRAGSASVVLFSTVAVGQGMPMHASVAAAKGAVEGLTRALAAELAPRVRVNAIAPSLLDTPMSAPLLSDDKRREAAAKRHPLNRIGDAEQVARVAADLMAGPMDWITGQVLHVDGGLSSVRLLN